MSQPRFSGHLVLAVVVRALVNTALRMVYPFLPAFARGLGVETAVLARIVAARGFAGVASPLLGGVSDRFGRKPMLVAATAVFAVACLLPVVHPAVALFGASLILVGLAKTAFDPAFHGLVADEVPYARRGLAVGLSETSWALALLVGAPSVAWMLAGPALRWPWLGPRPAWTTPFAVLGLAGIVGALALAVRVPGRGAWPATGHPRTTLLAVPALLATHPAVRAAAAFSLLATAAMEAMLIALGPWLETAFGLSLAGLGLAAVVIGSAELVGELGTGPLVDRLGKRRVVLASAAVCAVLFAILPVAGAGLATALALVAAIFVAFETSIVGAIPMFTEIVPAQRAGVISLTVASMSVGRGLGALAGVALWERGGIGAVGAGAALATVAAAIALASGMDEPGAADAL